MPRVGLGEEGLLSWDSSRALLSLSWAHHGAAAEGTSSDSMEYHQSAQV